MKDLSLNTVAPLGNNKTARQELEDIAAFSVSASYLIITLLNHYNLPNYYIHSIRPDFPVDLHKFISH